MMEIQYCCMITLYTYIPDTLSSTIHDIQVNKNAPFLTALTCSCDIDDYAYTDSLFCFTSVSFCSNTARYLSLHGSQPCHGEGACVNSMKLRAILCRATQDARSWWRALEEGMAAHSSILATRAPEAVWTDWGLSSLLVSPFHPPVSSSFTALALLSGTVSQVELSCHLSLPQIPPGVWTGSMLSTEVSLEMNNEWLMNRLCILSLLFCKHGLFLLTHNVFQ